MTDRDDARDEQLDRDERDRAAELLGVWAVDAVDPEERALVERVLARDPQLRAEADELHRVTDRLAVSAAVEPPASLRESVLGAISAEPEQPEQPSRRWAWALAAAAAVCLAIGGWWGITALNQDAITDQDQYTAVEQVLQDPAAQHLTAELPEQGTLEIALGPDGTGVLTGRSVPSPGEERAYQLWTIDGDDAPASHGLVEIHDGRVLMPLDGVPAGAVVALTVEPAGGSEQPTTDPILAVETQSS
ncbi:anti-sigma factor domain-containing protein [Citricoccus muralis]|uniref:Regulator of SigK n=1 Tax=Citricoccus muralis TaxID=169134 RepID=A0ABY8H6S8_9MICC|nr:anti-sigma factor [Citricoccus muralis]WFP16852.1 anti-sigma factor [Citricoccus muralis]